MPPPAFVGLIAHADFDRAVLALGHDHGHGQSSRGIRRSPRRVDGGEQIGLAQGTLSCLEALRGDQLARLPGQAPFDEIGLHLIEAGHLDLAEAHRRAGVQRQREIHGIGVVVDQRRSPASASA